MGMFSGIKFGGTEEERVLIDEEMEDTTLLTLKKTVANFGRISSREGLEDVTFCDRFQKMLFNFVIISYGLFLGMTTFLSWREITSDWVFGILVFRILFTTLFALDFYFTFSSSSFSDIFHDFQFFVDLMFLVLDIVIIIQMTVICIKCSNGLCSSCVTLGVSLRYLFCICIFRLYKLCYVFHPLLKLSKGILLSLKSLCWTGVFVFLVIYCCSILTTWSLNDIEDEKMDEFWGSLIRSMYTLFTVVTLEGWNEVSAQTAVHYPYCKLFFVAFISFTTLTVMNVVTGIILNTFISAKEALSAENHYKDTFETQFHITNTISSALSRMNRKDSVQELIFDNDRDTRIRRTSSSHFGSLFRRLFYRCTADRITEHVNSQAKCKNTTFIRFPFLRKDSANSSPETESHRSEKNSSAGFYHSEKEQLDDIKLVVDNDIDNANHDVSVGCRNSGLEDATPTYRTANSDCVKRTEFNSAETKCSDIQCWPNSLDEKLILDHSDMTGQCRENIIDLTKQDPLEIINDPVMEKALNNSNVPKYLAYDVLSLYWANGFKRINASDFAIACSKSASGANNRQLLALELLLTRRIDAMEAAISQISENINTLVLQLKNTKED